MPDSSQSQSQPAPAASAAQTGGAPVEPKQDSSSKPEGRGRDQRIEQLVREKYEFKTMLEQERASREELAREVASLKEQHAAKTRSDEPITSISQYSDAELRKFISEGAEANPAGYAVAFEEMTARIARKTAEDVSRQQQRLTKLELEQRDVRAEVAQTFGPQAWNTGSELYQKANAIYDEFLVEAQQKFGKEQGTAYIKSMPSIQKRCFELADRELRRHDLDEVPRLRRVEEQAKLRESLERGIGQPVLRDQGFKEALERAKKTGDRKALLHHIRSQRNGQQG